MTKDRAKFEVIRENTFVFGLKGMPEIALEIKDISNPDKVVLGAISDKLPFTLTADLEEQSENKTTASLQFEGKFNAMMAMMIKNRSEERRVGKGYSSRRWENHLRKKYKRNKRNWCEV